MFTAYFISGEGVKRKQIAKGYTLDECRKAFQETSYWKYIQHLMEKKQITLFEEYIFITKPNGDRVFDTKQHQEEQKKRTGLVPISEIIPDVLGDLLNEKE